MVKNTLKFFICILLVITFVTIGLGFLMSNQDNRATYDEIIYDDFDINEIVGTWQDRSDNISTNK